MIKYTLLIISITFIYFKGIYSQPATSDLQVNPEKFEDSGKPFVEFSCTTYLKAQQWLSWYQEKPSSSETITLTTYKQKYDGYKTIELLLTLDKSNNDSFVYCIKHDEIWNWGFRTYNTVSKCNHIPISFQRSNVSDIMRPQVTPDTFVYNGQLRIKFTCWAYIQENDLLTWYQEKDSTIIKTLAQARQVNNYGYIKIVLTKILEPSDIGTQVYCVKENMKSNAHIVKELESKKITLMIQESPVDVWGPRVEPKSFIDDGRSPNIEYQCSAYLYQREVLTWFQINESKKRTRLAMIQQNVSYGKLDITLQKTLLPSDNESQIYCAKEIFLFENDIWNLRTQEESKRIVIKLNRNIKPLETPYAFLGMNANIIYDDNKFLDFVCNGSKPVDGRRYTLNIKDPKSQQVYRYSSDDFNKFSIYMVNSFHKNQLYCVQDYNLVLEKPDFGKMKYCYGELVRSDAITLLYRYGYERPDEKPLVTPNSYKDEGRPLIESACYAFVQPSGVLAWFQTKGTQPSINDTLLEMIHLNQSYEAQWIHLPFNYILQLSDNDTNIYCAKQTMTSEGSLKGSISNLILIKKRQLEPLEALGYDSTILAISVPLVSVAVLAAILLWLRRRRSLPPASLHTPEPSGKPADIPAPCSDESDIYANYVNLPKDKNPSEVTYVVLDLSKKAATDIRAPNTSASANIHGALKKSGKTRTPKLSAKEITTSERSHYAEIIGVYLPTDQEKYAKS